MLPDINQVRGVHPGAILKRELARQSLKNVQLASAIDEYPQTIHAIIKGKRGVNPKLSIKLGAFFRVSDDYFMLLQAAYEVRQALFKHRKDAPPIASKLRKSLFWDTNIETIDWEKHKRAIIQRVFERGTQREIEELIKFYGMDEVRKEVKHITHSLVAHYEENVQKYLANPHAQ